MFVRRLEMEPCGTPMGEVTFNTWSLLMSTHRRRCFPLEADHNVGLVQAKVDGEALGCENSIDMFDKFANCWYHEGIFDDYLGAPSS